MKASFSFVKTQVIVSPAWREREPAVSESPFEDVQTVEVRSQPAGTISLTEYVAGLRSPLLFWPLSERKKFAAHEGSNSNDFGSPPGFVCFSTTMKASFSFVNVQWTVSPATRTIFTNRSPRVNVAWKLVPSLLNVQVEAVPSSRTQVMSTRSQPDSASSSTV